MGRSIRFSLAAMAAAALFAVAAADSRAADLAAGGKIAVAPGAQLTLVCDNGRSFPIRPRAVSDEGELVTGFIVTAPRRSHHFRLVPMGNGYRYAGAGFWFDGIRGEATLDIGSHATSCMVEYS